MAPNFEVKSPNGTNYFVRKLIGKGGMGRIYTADPGNTGALVVMKELINHNDPATNKKWIELFAREARAHGLVPSGVAVPRFRETFDFGGKKYMTMERINGINVLEVLSSGRYPSGHMDENRVLQIGIEAAEVLQALHDLGYLHRDVNPKNIMEEENTGKIFVIDFGICHQIGAPGAPPVSVAQSNATNIATIAYTSEQQLTNTHTSVRDDVYSLALTLYHLLTGTEPQQNLDDRVDDIRKLSPRFQVVFSKAVQRDWQSRQSSMREFQNDLKRLAGLPVTAQAAAQTSTTPFRPQQRPGQAGAAATFVPPAPPQAPPAPVQQRPPITIPPRHAATAMPTPTPTPAPTATPTPAPAGTTSTPAKSARTRFGGFLGGLFSFLLLAVMVYAFKSNSMSLAALAGYFAWLCYMAGDFAGSGGLDKQITGTASTTPQVVFDSSKIVPMLMPRWTGLALVLWFITFFL